MKKIWRIWAKSLGEKVGETDRQANAVAIVRSFWWVVHIITCFMIIIHNAPGFIKLSMHVNYR